MADLGCTKTTTTVLSMKGQPVSVSACWGLLDRSDVLTFCRAAYRFRESAVLREPVDAIETALHVQHAILLQRGKLYTKVYVQL